MGQQVREIFGWARRRKLLASGFLVLTLVVGILIGSIVSGRTSAMKAMSTFAKNNATPLSLPDPIPSSASFSGIVSRVEPAVVNIATTQVLERKPTVHKRRSAPGGQGNGQGYGMNYLDYARKLGADAMLPKPFRPAELMALVDKVLSRVADVT